MNRSYWKLAFSPSVVENSLANRFIFSNPIRTVKPISPVPRKNNIAQSENDGPSEPGASPVETKIGKTSARPAAAGGKNLGPARKKSATERKKKPLKPAVPERTAEPSDEEIRLRAYFISERRHRLALAGDASSDWLEAKRQLLSETGRR